MKRGLSFLTYVFSCNYLHLGIGYLIDLTSPTSSFSFYHGQETSHRETVL